MKLGILISTNDPETAWNALRLGITAREAGHQVTVFLLGSGVEIENVHDPTFNASELLQNFARHEQGSLLGCGTCMGLRHREAGVVLKSTMTALVKLIADSDKVVSFG